MLIGPLDLGIVDASAVILKKSQCDRQLGKIRLMKIIGADGSRIHDESYGQDLSVTLQEDTTYHLQVNLACDPALTPKRCNLNQDVYLWLDWNGNGLEENEEGRIFSRRRQNNRKRSDPVYNLDLSTPMMDGRDVRAGAHLMRLTVIPDGNYRRDCGARDQDREIRDYTVYLVSKAGYIGHFNFSCLFNGALTESLSSRCTEANSFEQSRTKSVVFSS